MRSSWNMWEPSWVSRSRCWLLTGERLGHVCMSPEPVGSTHLRFDDARVIKEVCMWLPNVVRSPGRHEEFRNGPEVKIYIWEVPFWPPEEFRASPVMYRDHRRVPGVHREGPPAPEGPMGCMWRGTSPLVGWAPSLPGPMRLGVWGNPKGRRPPCLGGQGNPPGRRPLLRLDLRGPAPLSLAPIYMWG